MGYDLDEFVNWLGTDAQLVPNIHEMVKRFKETRTADKRRREVIETCHYILGEVNKFDDVKISTLSVFDEPLTFKNQRNRKTVGYRFVIKLLNYRGGSVE